jgi:monoterpene epsilon-lactone hydrolase
MSIQHPGQSKATRGLLCCTLLLLGQALCAQPAVTVDSDGTVHMPAQAVPLSPYMSPEGRTYLNAHLQGLKDPGQQRLVDGVPALIAGYLERQRELFPARTEASTVGGVRAVIYEPSTGIAPENRD